MGDGGRFFLIFRGREDLIRGGGAGVHPGAGPDHAWHCSQRDWEGGMADPFPRSSWLQGGEWGVRAGGEGGTLGEWGGNGGREGVGPSGR